MIRFQIIKKTDQGVFRTSVNTVEELERVTLELTEDASTKYIVVKDRYLRTRGLVWRRGQEQVDWWVLDRPRPEIIWRTHGTHKRDH